MIVPVDLMYFVMLRNTFRERTCKHESKRKSYEVAREDSIIFRFDWDWDLELDLD